MTPALQALREVIAEEAAAMIAFVSLLETEKRLLIEAQASELDALTARKTELVAQLTRIGERRDQTLKTLGATTTSHGVATLLEQQAADLIPAWSALLEVAHTANRLNSANAALVNARLQQNQQALSILMSVDGDNKSSTSTYGPDGHQIQGGKTRTLGSA